MANGNQDLTEATRRATEARRAQAQTNVLLTQTSQQVTQVTTRISVSMGQYVRAASAASQASGALLAAQDNVRGGIQGTIDSLGTMSSVFRAIPGPIGAVAGAVTDTIKNIFSIMNRQALITEQRFQEGFAAAVQGQRSFASLGTSIAASSLQADLSSADNANRIRILGDALSRGVGIENFQNVILAQNALGVAMSQSASRAVELQRGFEGFIEGVVAATNQTSPALVRFREALQQLGTLQFRTRVSEMVGRDIARPGQAPLRVRGQLEEAAFAQQVRGLRLQRGEAENEITDGIQRTAMVEDFARRNLMSFGEAVQRLRPELIALEDAQRQVRIQTVAAAAIAQQVSPQQQLATRLRQLGEAQRAGALTPAQGGRAMGQALLEFTEANLPDQQRFVGAMEQGSVAAATAIAQAEAQERFANPVDALRAAQENATRVLEDSIEQSRLFTQALVELRTEGAEF